MRFTIIFIIASNISWSQSAKTISEIDSSLMQNPGIENFRYYYGSNSYTISDFRMDTNLGKLTRFIYSIKRADTLEVEYHFIDNYLVKVSSSKIAGSKNLIIGTYYLNDNKVIYRTGKNLRIEEKGSFRKIAPRLFADQLEYIYYQYEFLKPSKKRYQIHVPRLLGSIRKKLDRYEYSF